MGDRDNVQRLARRAGGGDLEAARRLVATLERMATNKAALESEERATWATFSRRKPKVVKQKGEWTILCPVCGNDDEGEFSHRELVEHVRDVASVSKGSVVFHELADQGEGGELQALLCRKCDSMFDFPDGVEVDFGDPAHYDFDESEPDDECSCDGGDPDDGFNPLCQVHGSHGSPEDDDE